jgi:hypothetical protein
MPLESAINVSGVVTVKLTAQELADLQRAIQLLQSLGHAVAAFEPRLVNFDTLPDGSTVASATDLTHTQPYGVWGGMFSVIPGPGPDPAPGGVFASAASDAPSAPNVCSLYAPPTLPHFCEAGGKVKATFSVPMGSVSIDVVPTTVESLGVAQDAVYLKGFNATGVQVVEDSYMPAVSGQLSTVHTLQISRSEHDISSVEFSVAPDSAGTHRVFAEFDNLAFSRLG